jgi:hypothetical protein
MTTTREALPDGRYGRSGDVRADRRLKIIGVVLGAALLAVVGWSGYAYVAGQDVSAELIKFKVVSDEAVEAHLEVHKDADVTGVCTLRSLNGAGGEVGRKDVTFVQRDSRVDQVVTIRTISRAAVVELVGCESVDGG